MNILNVDDKKAGVRKLTAESLESAADSIRAAGDGSAGAISDLANEAGKKLDSGATYVRTVGDESAGAINDLAKGAGKKLDSSANYVRTFAGGDVLGGLRHTIRRNPMGSLAVASAVGLVAGLAWRSSCSGSNRAS